MQSMADIVRKDTERQMRQLEEKESHQNIFSLKKASKGTRMKMNQDVIHFPGLPVQDGLEKYPVII